MNVKRITGFVVLLLTGKVTAHVGSLPAPLAVKALAAAGALVIFSVALWASFFSEDTP
jgi:hypothetical protein